MKADLSKLTIKQRTAYYLLKMLEPSYLALRDYLQSELNRIENLKAIAKGQELFEKLQAYKAKQGPALPTRESPEARLTRRQTNCTHVKGSRSATHRDYNLMHHFYIDGSQQIKCLSCGRPWWKTKTYTDTEWNVAIEMMKSSTNTASSSELPAAVNDSRTQAEKDGPNGPNYLPQ